VAETTRQLLLKKAAQLLGRTDLAIRLKVPVPLLDAWIAGHGSMPDRKLTLLADLLEGLEKT
jgi:hypothetical protein